MYYFKNNPFRYKPELHEFKTINGTLFAYHFSGESYYYFMLSYDYGIYDAIWLYTALADVVDANNPFKPLQSRLSEFSTEYLMDVVSSYNYAQ